MLYFPQALVEEGEGKCLEVYSSKTKQKIIPQKD